jgi:hypothetical protein
MANLDACQIIRNGAHSKRKVRLFRGLAGQIREIQPRAETAGRPDQA